MFKKENLFYEINRDEINLLEYSNIFVGNLVWIDRGIHDEIATYDLVVRDIPENWNYYVFYGLERFIDILENYSFSKEDIHVLKKMGLVNSDESNKFYSKYKFDGDVSALKDGTVFFPGEPIVRITAPIAKANILTAFILNVFSYPIRQITKKTRVINSLSGKPFLDSTVVRLPGFEQGLTCLETAYLLGSPIIAPIFFKKNPEIPTSDKLTVNINHAFIKSFETEREAYKYAIANYFEKANLLSVMVDTYDLKKGLDIFIEEINNIPEDKDINLKKILICIDSGDLEEMSYYVRNILDQKDLKDIGILVMSNLDEYQIDKMVKNQAPIDYYIAGTEIVNVTDNPKLESVYKIAQIIHKDGSVEDKAKLTKGKESYPGKKQVYRVYDEKGFMSKDIIGIDDEELGEPLLHECINKGKRINKKKSLDEIKKYLENQLSILPEKYKNIHENEVYPVEVSEKLNKLTEEIRNKHLS